MRERRLFIFLNVAALVGMLILVAQFPPLPVYDARYFPTPMPFIPTVTLDPVLMRTATAVVKQATRAVAQTATSAAQTATPAQQVACAWAWNTQPLPDLTDRVQKAFSEVAMTGITVRAGYYGEDCIDPTTNEHVRFAIRQTDYHLTIQVRDVPDPNYLPYDVMNLLTVLRPFLTTDASGVPPGDITLAFRLPDGTPAETIRVESSVVRFGFEYNYDALGMYSLIGTATP
jgi:hypothetical protein